MAKLYQLTGALGEVLFIDPQKVDYVKEIEKSVPINDAHTAVIVCVNGREIEVGECLGTVQDVLAGIDDVSFIETK